jgi:DNA invertase Pin-like site-specific DNA recombinase
MGRFIFTLFSALAQLEREQIAERTSAAMLRHQAKGRRMTRADRCPYGWKVDPRQPERLAEDDAEQAVIARIRQERQKSMSLREIAASLDRTGVRCRGRRWEHSAIRSILRRYLELAEVPDRCSAKGAKPADRTACGNSE